MQTLTCYNEATKNALALLATAESMADSVTGLKENETDMTESSTSPSISPKVIPLTRGMIALVDAEDYERVARYEWSAHRQYEIWYAARKQKVGPNKWRRVLMHRFILNAPKGRIVDHKDGDGLNNTRDNIRYATPLQNLCNSKKRNDSRNMYKGVGRVRGRNKVWQDAVWRADCSIGGKKIYLGVFRSEEEAARAYDRKAKELAGKFARLNFPDG